MALYDGYATLSIMEPNMSGDGRYIVFTTGDAFPGDTNGSADVYLLDRVTQTTERISVGSDGAPGNAGSRAGSISQDGRFVAFQSGATNFASGLNTFLNVYVRDRALGTTTLVSAATDGTPADSTSFDATISGNGRYVVFQSYAYNLVPPPAAVYGRNLFLRDLLTGVTTLVSVGTDGNGGNNDSFPAVITNDGRFIAFVSTATNLAPIYTYGAWNVFVRDTVAGTTELVSLSGAGGLVPNGVLPEVPAISADGRFVAFSSSNAYVASASGSWGNVYLRDRVAGATELVSISSSGVPGNYYSSGQSISSDGRFVAFRSGASNLSGAIGDANGAIDAFVRDRVAGVTELVSSSVDGWQANGASSYPLISVDGSEVLFLSDATNLVECDANSRTDLFMRHRALPAPPPTPCSTATPSATPTQTATPTATPIPEFFVKVDCDPALAGIQANCSYPVDAGALDVDIYVVSESVLTEHAASFNFELHAPDLARLSPLPGLDVNLDGNPDFNQSLAGSWTCAGPPPNPNTGADGPGKAVSFLSCFDASFPLPSGALLPAGGQLKLGTVHYQVPPGASPGSVPLVLSAVSVGNDAIIEYVSCLQENVPPAFPIVVGPCMDGVINLFEPPTATPTSTPTPTPTPAVGMAKVPEGSVASGNVDLSVPKANLFLCITGPCAGPGEGDLVVVERVSNITTGDSNGDMVQDGLGAYEFNVEYDNFVIQSVNPSDIVFAAGGAGAARGPASCSFSLVLENKVRFGCVTTGSTPNGPIGSFDLAKLDLIPHPDLMNDLFPGNDNGVPTVIKDNGCELADVFGHPVLGSVGGGLLPTCGDLAVTVRILEGDLNLDCKVDVTDEQLIGVHYAAVFGSTYYSKWFDLEPRQHDLDIDIKDVQRVFGRDGSTCQQPIPLQTPVDPPAPFGL